MNSIVRIVERVRVYDTLRFHHYRGIGDPYFVRGHYVVRTVSPLRPHRVGGSRSL